MTTINYAGGGPTKTVTLILPDDGTEWITVAVPLDPDSLHDTTLQPRLIADRLAREAANTVRPIVEGRIIDARRTDRDGER